MTDMEKEKVMYLSVKAHFLWHFWWLLSKRQIQMSGMSKWCTWAKILKVWQVRWLVIIRMLPYFLCQIKMSTLPTLNARMRNIHIGWCSCSLISESHLSTQNKPSNIFSFIRLLFILRQHINFHFVCLRFPARSPRELRTLFFSNL